MEFFETLGTHVSRQWKENNYNEEVFPEIATAALTTFPPAQHISLWDIVRWAMTTDQLPRQDDLESRFGNPPLNVYNGRKFRIEVLFWTRGLPAIHQHSFSGAFHVLHGSSIHTIWDFAAQEQIETRLLLGQVSFRRSEILHKGDSRAILSGNKMFHSTYHLDCPSISVVVRTLSEADKAPQYSLMPPTIAIARQEIVGTVRRQTQILDMLISARKHAEFREITRHVCATKDAYSVFQFLVSVFSSVEDEEDRQDMLFTAKHRHEKLICALEPALVDQEIGDKILGLYGVVESAELRFFLALLRNVPERAAILDLVRQRFPEQDARDAIVGWVGQLSELGVNASRFDDHSLLALKCLLADNSSQEVLTVFRQRYEHTPDIAALNTVCAHVQDSWLLKSLGLSNPFQGHDASRSTPNRSQTAEELGELECSTSERPPPVQARTAEPANTYRCALDAQPEPLVPQRLTKQWNVCGNSWIVNPLLVFSATGIHPSNHVRFAESVTVREPTAWVGDHRTAIVAPFVLNDAIAAVVETLQPGHALSETHALDTVRLLASAGIIYQQDTCTKERASWLRLLEDARADMQGGYAKLGTLLHPFILGALRAYYRRFVQLGSARYGDSQTPRRWNAHNEPVARFIHHQLTPVVQAATATTLKPSYVYFSSYRDGARLPRHVDRAQCELSLSMLIDYIPEPETRSPWPLWLETEQEPIAIHQSLGDVLIYRGRQLPHYREELPNGDTSTHLFFHYVPRDFDGTLD